MRRNCGRSNRDIGEIPINIEVEVSGLEINIIRGNRLYFGVRSRNDFAILETFFDSDCFHGRSSGDIDCALVERRSGSRVIAIEGVIDISAFSRAREFKVEGFLKITCFYR